MMPDGVAGYYYWARSLMKQDRAAEATALVGSAQRNAKQIANYAELAYLYFWLPDEANGVLERRTKNLPRVLGMLVAPENSKE